MHHVQSRRLLVPLDRSRARWSGFSGGRFGPRASRCSLRPFSTWPPFTAFDDAYDAANVWHEQAAGHGPQALPLAHVWSPEMAPFRHDPRFAELCARLKFTEYWNAYGPADGYELRGGTLQRRDQRSSARNAS